MNLFCSVEIKTIIFLCINRIETIGLYQATIEGTSALYTKCMKIIEQGTRMIDYKKLEIAHYLAFKCKEPMSIQFTKSGTEHYFRLIVNAKGDPEFFDFDNEDQLIAKLNEIIMKNKMEEMGSGMNRFNNGDIAWFVSHDNNIQSVAISDQNCDWRLYQATPGSPVAGVLFSSKKALIEAQLEYWKAQERQL